MSYYRTIDGIRYDADLLDKAAAMTQGRGDGRISYTDAQALLKEVQDGGRLTDTERDTLRYLIQTLRWTDKARAWLIAQLGIETDDAVAQARAYFEVELESFWRDAYKAHQAEEELEKAFWEEYEIEVRDDHPDEIAKAVQFYLDWVENQDWGKVRTYWIPNASLPFEGLEDGLYVVLAATDGEGGWAELYDAEEQTIGAARTWLELVHWGGRDNIRDMAAEGTLPLELERRKGETLWK